MKKVFLLLMSGVVMAGVSAQEKSVSPVFNTGANAAVDNGPRLTMPARISAIRNSQNKTTVGGSRWYSYAGAVDTLLGGNGIVLGNLNQTPIWFDSTVLQLYSTGYGQINYSSFAQVYDVISFTAFNDPFLYPTDISVSPTNSYRLDSVAILGIYQKNLNRPTSIVDTMIIAVGASSGFYRLIKTQSPWVSAYLPSGKDTLLAFTPYNVDSVNRHVLSDVSTVNPIIWKVPLTDAMRDTGFSISDFRFAVPNGGLTLPANTRFQISATFKSGDTWTPNVDSFNAFHNMRLISSSRGSSNPLMPYFYYSQNDRNASNLMFSTDPSSYLPAVYIEGLNTTAFNKEFHLIDAYVTCATCQITNVANVENVSLSAAAYPNPANTEINIPFTANVTTDVKMSISNAVGQVMKVQNLGKFNAKQSGVATFNVTDMPSGLYFYTIEADGQRVTKRMVVTH